MVTRDIVLAIGDISQTRMTLRQPVGYQPDGRGPDSGRSELLEDRPRHARRATCQTAASASRFSTKGNGNTTAAATALDWFIEVRKSARHSEP